MNKSIALLLSGCAMLLLAGCSIIEDSFDVDPIPVAINGAGGSSATKNGSTKATGQAWPVL